MTVLPLDFDRVYGEEKKKDEVTDALAGLTGAAQINPPMGSELDLELASFVINWPQELSQPCQPTVCFT